MALDEQGIEFALFRECTIIARRWRAYYDARIAEHGLTAARASVLYWLSESEKKLRQSELAKLVGIEGPTLVRLLHALEEGGFVERSSVEGDRRAKQLVLTTKGRDAVQTIRHHNVALGREVLSKIPRRRVSAALKSLEPIRAVMNNGEQ
jgi:MarR family transcriptional regulator for hemolysin